MLGFGKLSRRVLRQSDDCYAAMKLATSQSAVKGIASSPWRVTYPHLFCKTVQPLLCQNSILTEQSVCDICC